MKILGIDPGIATTGFAIIEMDKNDNNTLIDYGIIETDSKDSFIERLSQIKKDLTTIIRTYKPDICGIEKIYFHSNTKTVIDVSQSRGMILSTLFENNIQILEFTPLEIKNGITGDGKADKLQVQTMIKKIFKLEKLPKPDDASDAIAIALLTAYKKDVRL